MEIEINTDRLEQQCRENDAFWRGYHYGEGEPLLNEKQVIYVLFTLMVILLGIFIWLLGTIIIRSIT